MKKPRQWKRLALWVDENNKVQAAWMTKREALQEAPDVWGQYEIVVVDAVERLPAQKPKRKAKR